MKKVNNKGFMLVEVIITSAIIIGAMVSLYVSFNRLYIVYNERGKYYDVDGLYAAKVVEDYLIDELVINNLISGNNDYHNLLESNSACKNGYCCSSTYFNVDQRTYCNEVIEHYDITCLYFAKNTTLALEGIKQGNPGNDTLNEYIDYLEKSDEFSSEYSYIFILEEKKSDADYYYANLKVR